MSAREPPRLDAGSELPAGFTYRADLVGAAEERDLVEQVRALPFAQIRMRGQVARRRTVHFGWLYGYESLRIAPGPPLPAFLLPLRARAAALAGVAPGVLEEVLLTEYPAGAGIGWHRDAPGFGDVIGVSLLAACRMRFRRPRGDSFETAMARLEPRSAYLLSGAARWQWQHSIPPVAAPRYSITFRRVNETGGLGGGRVT